MRLFAPLLTAVAAWAIFMPAIGPLVDHHFTERQPEHAHAYTAGSPDSHLHPFERPHDHQASADPVHAPGDAEAGIVFLPPDDGGALGASLDAAPPDLASMRYPASVPAALPEAPSISGAFADLLEPPPPRPSS